MIPIKQGSISLSLWIISIAFAAQAPRDAVADVPREMTFQGRLAGNGTDPVSVEVRFYDAATAGTLLWSETHSSVQRLGGLFTINVGSVAGGVPDSALDAAEVWLAVVVNGGAELAPRTRLVMAPYAAKATSAEQIVRPGSLEPLAYAETASDRSWLCLSAQGAGSDNPGLAFVNQAGTRQWCLAQQESQLRLIDMVNGVHAECIWNLTGDMSLPRGYLGVGTVSPDFPADVVTANNEDTFNIGLRISRYSDGITPLRLGNYFKTSNWRQGGMISTDESLNIAYNQGGGSASFNVFNNPNNYDIDTATPVLSCASDGSTSVRVLHILGGSDLAEPGHVSDGGLGANAVKPGMVVSIDPTNPGGLVLATEAYDRKVAGAISGAGGVSPGMIMKQEGHPNVDGEHPIAMAGKVYVWADADANGAIQPGDRLTTSATPGHAMRACDETRMSGAVIGKAMTELKSGRGLVLLLVQPQ